MNQFNKFSNFVTTDPKERRQIEMTLLTFRGFNDGLHGYGILCF